ncbi:capsular exopolysaccharide family domain protein [Synechococcus sp. MEDNS5]|uniref:GumC family protein n=1 Tax=Synechococcus sp. MEDNS5 TaxID=1442554 RepID=UPI001861F081|nr:Wzz/FepE/Etk N-terminal domain-containing protein [Synechococcus sp. MEDNS5]QNJ04955.1 capsular exopolysaccharide family domain protein [Synechococcus sp. MEDNS5]
MTSAPADQTLLAQPGTDDEIDLRQVPGALVRRWPWIVVGGSLGLLIAGIQLARTKPVYQGEFQIVLSGEKAGGAAALFSQNAALAGLGGAGGNDSIATEVQILNSPSVLLPVFDAVKARKPPEVAKAMRFQDWANSAITAEEEKGTSVLNVEFRDTDEQLVLPITRMISQAYQSYSNRGRSRELNNVIAYLQAQIAQIKPQAEASSRAALDYGYANGLGLLDGLPLAGNVAGTGVSKDGVGSGASVGRSGGSVEAARTAAQQKVKALEVQIQEATKAGAGSLYFASQLASLTDKSSTFDQLTSVETRLAELRSRFKDSDPLVQKLQRERNTLVRYINQQTIALLKGELDLAKANLQALDRPKDVVSRHRELTQQALRDEATLVTLQNQLKQFELEQARATSPWELISTPTLLDSPVSPSKKRTLALGLLAGLVLGSGGALVSDRRSGRVFSSDELSRDLPGPLLERLPCQGELAPQAWSGPIQLLADGPLAASSLGSGAVALIPVGSLDPAALEAFSAELRRALGSSRELLMSRDLLATRACSTQLLLTAPGAAKREQLRQLREQLSLQAGPVAGWVLLDTELESGLDA